MPGLPAKPIIDIDVVIRANDMDAGIMGGEFEEGLHPGVPHHDWEDEEIPPWDDRELYPLFQLILDSGL